MYRHLRLARERGSLRAPNSLVQDNALDILDMLAVVKEQREKRQDGIAEVKALMLTHGYTRTQEMFPDYFDSTPPEQDGQVDEEHLEWDVPSEEVDEQISRWIAERQAGSFTGSEWH